MSVVRTGSLASEFHELCRNLAFPTIVAACLFGMVLQGRSAQTPPPTIYLIELYSTNQVLVHFDTAPNRKYVLQYTDKMGTNGFASSTWSNLYTNPVIPFEGHYIINDTRTNKSRFYRLWLLP